MFTLILIKKETDAGSVFFQQVQEAGECSGRSSHQDGVISILYIPKRDGRGENMGKDSPLLFIFYINIMHDAGEDRDK